jgi:hypothetical protein
MTVTTVVPVSAGAYYAGRCSPVPDWLQGRLAWAVMILCIVFGFASIIGVQHY